MTEHPRHGEVWWCELPEVGRRPVVVLSRAEVVRSRRRAVVAPCTTNVRQPLGSLSPVRMRAVCAALGVALDCR